MPQGWDFGTPGSPGGQNFYFIEHGLLAKQIDGDDRQNRLPVEISPSGQICDLWARS